MELFRIFAYIISSIILIFFFGIPAIVTGIKEWKGYYYSKPFCIILIVFGIMMIVVIPCMAWFTWFM